MQLRTVRVENIDAVNVVLEEIDAHEIPTLLVMNKIDMLDDFRPWRHLCRIERHQVYSKHTAYSPLIQKAIFPL